MVSGLSGWRLSGRFPCSAPALDPSHESQLLNYLRATDVEVGLLLNFGPKPEFKRLIFDKEMKGRR